MYKEFRVFPANTMQFIDNRVWTFKYFSVLKKKRNFETDKKEVSSFYDDV